MGRSCFNTSRLAFCICPQKENIMRFLDKLTTSEKIGLLVVISVIIPAALSLIVRIIILGDKVKYYF